MRALFLLPLAALALAALAAEPVEVKISVAPGLKFDLTRFAVPPGAAVTVKFSNPDQMIHNFVITAPEARMEVVTAALALGAEGPAKNFIPETKKVLWATKALNPGEKTELTFTAPAEEGVYPYVCTSMGHGVIMYGAMYVTTKPLPPLGRDPNVPPVAVAIDDASDLSHRTLDHPYVSRTFLPEAGPAAMAVGLPGGVSYCFDAGLCRLRYAWKGGFVDNTEHWAGKGEVQSHAVGRIWYRAPQEPVIRLGHAGERPAARWQGYSWHDGSPTFHYTLDGAEVRETPRPLTGAEGTPGLVFAYEIDSRGESVYLVTDPDGGAAFTASAGEWKDGILTLSPEQARHFTLTMTERAGVEPLVYWSMNDAPLPGAKMPPPGVLGRAFIPGGEAKAKKELASGVTTEALKQGGTLMAWVQLAPAKSGAAPAPAPVFATAGEEGFTLAAQLPAGEWHHLAWTVEENGAVTAWRDGQPAGKDPAHLPASPAPILLGSHGKTFLPGLLDEVRIYDRSLSGEEIRRIWSRESAGLNH